MAPTKVAVIALHVRRAWCAPVRGTAANVRSKAMTDRTPSRDMRSVACHSRP